jgi:hypothetical protein
LFGLAEIAVFTSGYYWLLWGLGPHLDRPERLFAAWCWIAAAALYLLWVSPVLIHGQTLEQRGLGPARGLFIPTFNLREAAGPYGLATAAGAAVLLSAALWRNPRALTELNWEAFFLKLGLYVLSGIVQATVFFQFILQRLKDLCSDRRLALGLTAMIFMFYHLPNLPLMFLALPAGLIWSRLYLKWPNLILAAASQAVVGTILHRVVAMNMRVGPFYWQRDKFIWRKLFPILGELIAGRF